MIFSTSTGAASGTPTTISAATTYTITITDSNGATAAATFSLAVNSAVVATTAISSSVLVQSRVATPFVPVTGSGGTGTLSYGISPALPAGLSLSSSTGSVSGTPTVAGTAATYTITVSDSNGASASAPFSLTVNSLVATATVVTSSNLTPPFGSSVVLTATVTPASTDVPPGTVSFFDGSTILGTSAVNTAGVATLNVSLPQGANAITAVYSGSARYVGSTSSALSVSALAATATTFSASPTTQLYNNPIVLTAHVDSPTAGTLTGSVSFLDGTTVIAKAAIGANGVASASVTSLAQGSHSLTATYSGDGNFEASVSTGTGIAVTVGNINLNLGNDQNQTVLPGGTASYTFPLSPLVTPTFIYQVQLTATGLPPGATYTFTPASIPAGSASLPITLTVQTAKGTASLSAPPPGGSPHFPHGLPTLAFGLILPLFGLKRVRRRLRAIPKPLAVFLFAAMSLGAMLALAGCGGGGFFGKTSTTGSYTITVTATSADLVRTSTVQLTIQ